MANARIQFSTAPETKWRQINPALREGELVVSKNSSNRYELRLGGPNGTKFSESVLVWSQTAAEKLTADALGYKNTAAQKATAAAQSANAAANSQNAAKTSAANAAASADAAALSESKLGALSTLNGIATQAEAEAGAVNNKVMTPLRTKQAATKYCLPRSGGEMNGSIIINAKSRILAEQSVDNDYLQLDGGSDYQKGAYLILAGKDYSSKGAIQLTANDGTNKINLFCSPDGTIKWDNKEIERIESLGANYIRYSSGLQVCWGNAGGTTVKPNSKTDTTINFPLPFKDLKYSIDLTIMSTSDVYADIAGIQIGFSARSNSNMVATLWAGAISGSRSPGFTWRAIGYWK